MKMFWRFIVPSLCVLVLFFTYFKRKYDFERNSDYSQFKFKIFGGKLNKSVSMNVSTKSESGKDKSINTDLVQDGIFWSDFAESLVPKGLDDNDRMQLVKKLRHMRVVKIESGNRSMCGNSNGIIALEDGTKVCAKHRRTHSIYAEALAFYLSRLLRLDNVPEVILSKLDGSSGQWKRFNFTKLNWKEFEEVAIIRWFNNARLKTFMPQVIYNAYKTGKPVNSAMIHESPSLRNKSTAIAELIQWGTLIVFDYLVGHHDRLIHYQLFGESGPRFRSFSRHLYNSVKSPNGKIWIIDNEFAFFTERKHRVSKEYNIHLLTFNNIMLKTMCIFQSSLVGELRNLHKYPSAFHHLWYYASSFEPLLNNLNRDLQFNTSAALFNQRLGDIIGWIYVCKSKSLIKK
ncbi:four-jointed box protein 1-like isoform X1 [Ruditapes philippinarum]|uniref:four-jointed box protein 1-like isoform X1 n=1 Tax=Ruditapes philippinarum TaxID=129788 RepID=UPI00295BA54C|nr:four-jointed box protein 1-like isoform X1 [Ruditapes philippinarum]